MATKAVANPILAAPPKRKLGEPLKTFTIKEYDPSSDILKLATQAKSVLGYDRLLTHLRQPMTLGRALMAMDIHPLEEKSVEEYKRKEMTAAKKRYHDSYNTSYRIRWQMLNLKEYTKPIPEFILAKAVQIAKKVPGVQLKVEELVVSTETKVHPRDPFLIASFQNENFYVEVWDEPKFETHLIDK